MGLVDHGVRPMRVGFVAVAVVVLFAGCGGPMTAGELRRSVETLESSAAQGKLLADSAAKDRTKTTYVRVFAREIGESADHEAEKLADAEPSAGLSTAK